MKNYYFTLYRKDGAVKDFGPYAEQQLQTIIEKLNHRSYLLYIMDEFGWKTIVDENVTDDTFYL